jgi:hypothetical protein
MSRGVIRHHVDWLKLVEHSGPFLSLPVLERAFPQELDPHDADLVRELREAFAEWQEACKGRRPDLARHQAWVRFVMREALGWTEEVLHEASGEMPPPRVELAIHRETLVPDLFVSNPSGHAAGEGLRVLVQVIPPDQPLTRALAGRIWHATPADRMVQLLRGANVTLGLVTNGGEWRLVHVARDEMPSMASWYGDLWFDEPITLRAFRSLLGARRLFAVAAGDSLEALLAESAKNQQEITDQLGLQVRHAVEVLVQALDRADRDSGGNLLAGVGEKHIYDAALTVMMRLVFLFAAEERGLIGGGLERYQEHYAVSTLRDQLQEAADHHGEEVLESRHEAWSRLLATFRLIHGGCEHEDLHSPAYGGSLFDPDRYPFLEGRAQGTGWRTSPAHPLPVNDRMVLHLLSALQMLRVKMPGAGSSEARRISFKGLGIENIGHVYEGLLDHTALRAKAPDAPLLGLEGKLEPEVPVLRLESLRQSGAERLVDYLAEETGRSRNAVQRAVEQPVVRDEARALAACGNDRGLYDRVKPWLGLVRDDTTAYPVIIREGAVFVTAGADRRTTGTHYTPVTLTEPIVQHALEPLVYEGPAEGRPESEWKLRSPRELLELKVCDFAMGSGAFLVQTCRSLAERLVEAWDEVEKRHPGRVLVTPEGDTSEGKPTERLIPDDPDERRLVAMRYVTDRCLCGVDLNPMAVEMAKLSLWLATMQKDRPFTFLDHALRAGDSLLGITSLDQLECFDLAPAEGQQIETIAEIVRPAVEKAIEKRRELESFPVVDITHAQRKAALLAEAERALADLRAVADLLMGCDLASRRSGADREALFGAARMQVAEALDERLDADIHQGRVSALRARAQQLLDEGAPASQVPRRPFHWPLEFPEVFAAHDGLRGGLDGVVANPPFKGGQKITGVLGTDYRDHLVEVLAGGRRGSADLCSYFLLRTRSLLREGGTLGMIATNTIAQGDTREVGLERMLGDGFVSPRAISSQKWPGEANLEVAVVWLRRGEWNGTRVLDGATVPGITPFLTIPGDVEGKPYQLAANAGKSFQGSIVLGMGFVLTPKEAQALIAGDPHNRDVLFPYLSGEDLNSRWDQSPSRWVINFRDWALDRASAPAGYTGPVATDYPDCLRIVEEKVRPERERNNRKVYRDRWWHYAEKRPDLYATIAGMERVLVIPETTKYCAFSVVPVGPVFSHMTKVITISSFEDWCVLTTVLHEAWAREYSSTLENRLKYITSDAFETFPFPLRSGGGTLDDLGLRACEKRLGSMALRREGLTSVYNRFHSPDERSPDIAELRELHAEMDRAVAAAYGWSDLDLGHGFHETKQGVRFTISAPARREVLARLLRLNHERYRQEVEQGLRHQPARRAGAVTGRRTRVAPPSGPGLFG